MRAAFAVASQKRGGRARATSLSTVPPAAGSEDYVPALAATAASILYLSPQPSPSGRRLYILNAAALPDANEVDYDHLLPYVLARLPGEDELLTGTEYEVIFFAGGPIDGATTEKREGPGLGWYLRAYRVLSRATRKKLQKLYIVHPRTWVRMLLGVFGTIVSPKFRRKIVQHSNTLTSLAQEIPIQNLLIPPSVYLHDRRLQPSIHIPTMSLERVFGARRPLPKNIGSGRARLPRVLRETTSFVLLPVNVRTEGIFRISPHATLQSILKEAYDRGQKYIVWKEKGACYASPGLSQSQIDEIRLEDSYGVHLAASLIKQWYRDLREPIFGESSYSYLRENFDHQDRGVSREKLIELISPNSQSSPLTKVSREILIRHLLPLLAAVVRWEADNKMSADNLAVCFSVCLICGSNQIEDAKISSFIRRIMSAAISAWPELRLVLQISLEDFDSDLAAPKNPNDYEDELDVRNLALDCSTAVKGDSLNQLTNSELPFDQQPPSTAPFWAPSRTSSLYTPLNVAITSAEKTAIVSQFVPSRKPAPPSPSTLDLIRLLDKDDKSHAVVEPLSATTLVDKNLLSIEKSWTFDEHQDFRQPTMPSGVASEIKAVVPKPKALRRQRSYPGVFAERTSDSSATQQISNEEFSINVEIDRMPTDLIEALSAVPGTYGTATIQPTVDTVSTQRDQIFPKPTWPTSTRPH